MLKKIILPVMLLSFLVSCNSQSAFKYSQDIVKKEQSLLPDINSTEDKIRDFISRDQFDSIAAAGTRMEKLVEEKITEIKDQPAPDVKEAQPFKDAALRYFRFIKSMYTGYKDFGNAPGPEARETEMGKLRNIVNDKTKAIQEMQDAQKKFATANGFKLDNQ